MSCETSQGYNSAAAKYNWSNVLAEYRSGTDDQTKLSHFKEIRIDYNYNYKLYGPFDDYYLKMRIVLNDDGSPKFDGGAPKTNYPITSHDGSNDYRDSTEYFYGDWSNASKFTEKANVLTHYVINPNVKKFFLTLQINNLSDTLEKSTGSYPDYTMEAGAQLPGILKFNVRWGKEDRFGNKTETGYREYHIVALITSATLLDVGNPDDSNGTFNRINFTNENLYSIFTLPDLDNPENATDLDVTYDERTKERRWVSVEKMTNETNSSLMQSACLVAKITEVQEAQFTYPYSTLVGTKLDSRVFSQIPKRTFDCRLKKIKIPTNYYPLNGDGIDKRYIKSWDGNACSSVYQGTWGGSFKMGWTDNPAWILYDMLSNPRYGLGNYVKEEDINKWDLYKIARWCDGLDENGHYIGVCDYKFGREPRFAANIMFSAETAIFDAINTIVSIFRGAIYYQNDKLEFTDDRPRPSIAFFNNHNVKDGLFSYSNYKKDEQYNSVEVIYIDKDDDYRSKAEYVQNNEDIGKRGPVTKTLNAIGCTSAGQARRTGLNLIYQTTIENQSVTFDCGYQAMLCKPGDYIEIEDELKTHTTNYGRIIEVNAEEGYLKLDNPYNISLYSSFISVYVPNETTYDGQNELNFELGSLNQTVQMKINLFTENDEYGCYVWIDPTDANYSLLQFVQAGTAYRFRKKTELSEVYKVLSIKENDKSDFSIIAQKYDPSRFDYVECDPIDYPDPPDGPDPDPYVPYSTPGVPVGTAQPMEASISNEKGVYGNVKLVEKTKTNSVEPIIETDSEKETLMGQALEVVKKAEEDKVEEDKVEGAIVEEDKVEPENNLEKNSIPEFKLHELNGDDSKEKEDIFLPFLDPFGYTTQPTRSE